MELYKHNKVTYDKAVDMLNTYGKVAIVQATGTGKSFVTMKLFQDHFPTLKKLYVVPKHSIKDSIRMYNEWSDENVTFATYQLLASMGEEALDVYCEHFDVLLCDEFHHTGALKWMKPIDYMSKRVKYFIGLSATNIRYLDNNRDMAKELFDNHVVYGPSLQTAIRDGILPKFQYISMLFDVEEFIRAYKSKVNSSDSNTLSKIARLRLSDNGSYELGVRFRKYRNPNNKKWIVFCSDIEQINDIDLDIKDWFNTNDIHIYKIYSGMSKSKLRDILMDYNADTHLSVIASVDMLNEGVHVDGVTGIIMLRKTNSLTVFLQQLGRALSASNKTVTPQIFDVVENYDNLKTMKGICQQIVPQDGEYTSISGKELFIVDDILMQAEDIIKSINAFSTPHEWQPWEDNLILSHYPVIGPNMYTMLIDVTKKQCVQRARELGIVYRKRWSVEEDAVIRQYYPTEGKDVYKRLSNRTKEACSSRASLLGVKYGGNWSIENDVILLKYYEFEGMDCFKRLPGFSFEECLKNAKRLKLT